MVCELREGDQTLGAFGFLLIFPMSQKAECGTLMSFLIRMRRFRREHCRDSDVLAGVGAVRGHESTS